MSLPFDLVLFDLDGTLIETAPEIFDATNDTLRHFGVGEVSAQQVRDWIGQGTRELLILALAYSTQTAVETVRASPDLPEKVAEFGKHYQRRCGTNSYLYPQVRETLLALRQQGIKLAVVTNKEEIYTRLILDAHQLAPLLDAVISGDTLSTKKPDPQGIARCLAEFGVTPERALFVGDSSIDVQTARNAGVPVWVLPYGYNMGQPIEESQPDRVIADCSALLV